jgi:hypothetical protein
VPSSKSRSSTAARQQKNAFSPDVPYRLARAFLLHVRGETIAPATLSHRIVLRQARDFLRDYADGKTGSAAEVAQAIIEALPNLVDAYGANQFRTIYSLRGADQQSGLRFLEGIIEAPLRPDTGTDDYDEWVRDWGTRAMAEGKWKGTYLNWDGRERTPENGPITYQELVSIVGEESPELSGLPGRDRSAVQCPANCPPTAQ